MEDEQAKEDGWLWEHNAPIRAFHQKLRDGICPTCNEPMTQEVQGGTVYAQPCGHVISHFQRYKTVVLEHGPTPEELANG